MPQATHAIRAQLLRKVSASTPITRTVRKGVRVLAEAGIPSLVVGDYAVQENGYARFTSDIDLVVPDVAAARARLSLNGFREDSTPRELNLAHAVQEQYLSTWDGLPFESLRRP